MVSTKKFSDFDDGGDIQNSNITVGLEGSDNVQFNNPWTFLPPGSTGDRPVPVASIYYRLRLNTTLNIYEYYNADTALWTELSGSGTGTVNPGTTNDLAYYAANGQTISPINSAANSVLVTNGSMVPSLSTTLPSGLTIPGATITGSTAALTSGSVVAAPVAGSDLVNKTYADGLFGSGVTSITGTTNQVIASSPTGAVTLSLPQDIAPGSSPTFVGLTAGNLNFTGNTIISTNANGNINYSPNGTGVNFFTKNIYVESSGSSAVTIFSPNLLGTTFTDLEDNGGSFSIRRTVPTGDSIISINPLPSDGVSDARIRLFRDSNTTSGAAGIQIYKANNTTDLQHYIRCNANVFFNALDGGMTVGSSNGPNGKLEVYSTSSGATTDVIRLTNATASAINTGVSLLFQPNGTSTRAASIRSIQTTAGDYADLEFFVANNAAPAVAMTINANRRVDFSNGISFDSGTNSLTSYVGRTAWTPVFTFSTPGDLVLSGQSITAWYERMGDAVLLLCNYSFTPTYTTSSGNAQITGVPIAAVSGQGSVQTSVLAGSGYVFPANGIGIFINLAGGVSIITFSSERSASGSLNASTTNFPSGVAQNIRFVTQYYVA